MAVIIADANCQIDSAYHTLVKHIPTDKTIVMVSWAENFVFNEELLSVKDFILIDFCEYGYDAHLTETHVWGVNSEKFPRYYTGDWIKFDNWIKENKPNTFFKRELHKKVAARGIFAIDYPSTVGAAPVQSEQEFNSRPLSACYYFGRSHESRLHLHASIWDNASRYGYSVCDNPFQMFGDPERGLGNFIDNELGKKYASFHMPHWYRIKIEILLHINGMSKIGIAPHGAGIKTFRATEVSSNAVMLMWNDDMDWSYTWIHGYNCLKCSPGQEVETIEKWSTKKELYQIYLSGVRTWEKYQTKEYINNYILPIINNA